MDDDPEPTFVLSARDPLAPILVSLWATLREKEGEEVQTVSKARVCAMNMIQWKRRNNKAPTIVFVE